MSHACQGLRITNGQFLPCPETRLCEAHIFPRSVARFIRDGSTHNMQVTKDSARTAQLGEYDPGILCAKCDNFLGTYDKYAIDLIRDFGGKHTTHPGDVFIMPDIDGDALAKFVLAVLWRASISARPMFKNFTIGKYETIAREVLFGAKPLNAFSAYQLMLGRYRSADLDTEKIYSAPQVAPFGQWQTFGFMLAGFRVMAKMDDVPLGSEWASFVVNGARSFAGFIADIEATSEYAGIRAMALAEAQRQRGKA
jgi:hypothetical protein